MLRIREKEGKVRRRIGEKKVPQDTSFASDVRNPIGTTNSKFTPILEVQSLAQVSIHLAMLLTCPKDPGINDVTTHSTYPNMSSHCAEEVHHPPRMIRSEK